MLAIRTSGEEEKLLGLLNSRSMNIPLIKEVWKEGELYKKGKIELVPTDWVMKYCGMDAASDACLMDGTRVPFEDLWRNLLEEGLYEPLIMRIGLKNKKFRLEAGNHRVRIFMGKGVPMIPVTVQVKDFCGPEAENVMTISKNNFDFGDEVSVSGSTEEYMKPSQVFKSLADIAKEV